jgi:hypothetical protein
MTDDLRPSCAGGTQINGFMAPCDECVLAADVETRKRMPEYITRCVAHLEPRSNACERPLGELVCTFPTHLIGQLWGAALWELATSS